MRYTIKVKKSYTGSIVAFVLNILLAYAVYMICRIVFVMENWGLYGDTLFENSMCDLLTGSLKFDTAAILYTHAIYAVMMLTPCHFKEKDVWQKAAKWVYLVVNGLAIIMNLCDAVYVQFTGRRSTVTVFSEFSNESNLGSILGKELLRHWYLVLVGIGMMVAMWWLYRQPKGEFSLSNKNKRDEEEDAAAPSPATADVNADAAPATTSTRTADVDTAPTDTATAKATTILSHVQAFSRRYWHNSYFRYYATAILAFALYIPLMIGGMRGGFTTAIRPITVSNAHQYVKHPSDAAVILNTPFSIIRTIGKTTFPIPHYFSEEELDEIYSPVHQPNPSLPAASSPNPPQGEGVDSLANESPTIMEENETPPNVVVLIVESFGREFIGAYNDITAPHPSPSHRGRGEQGEGTAGGAARAAGFTPFVDSLYQHCLSFDYTFANGRKSIDGMPSILASIPMFIEPFVLTPASMNKVSGLAGELGKVGYSSAFFHGAENSSMGFQAFARNSGFQNYYGRDEFNQDSRFRGDRDYDGTWAIWDEPFLQFYALTMSQMREPFMTAVFTASSHHPFVIPDHYKNVYPEEGDNPLHKCIRYTDHALQQFFETAKKQPWYKNTIFVLTSDHTNMPDHAEYKTDLGLFCAPILFYDPSGKYFSPGRRHCIAEQIDIMPSILGLLGYEKPFVAFGQDLFHTPDAEKWAVHYNSGVYQFVHGDYMLQFDGEQIKALYNYKNDWMLRNNLAGRGMPEEKEMERYVKAIIQSYMTRMNKDQLVITEDTKRSSGN